MNRLLAATGILAGTLAIVYLLAKMGAPGWFTLTFAGVLVGLVVAMIWPALIVAAVGFVVIRAAMWKARREGRRRWQ